MIKIPEEIMRMLNKTVNMTQKYIRCKMTDNEKSVLAKLEYLKNHLRQGEYDLSRIDCDLYYKYLDDIYKEGIFNFSEVVEDGVRIFSLIERARDTLLLLNYLESISEEATDKKRWLKVFNHYLLLASSERLEARELFFDNEDLLEEDED